MGSQSGGVKQLRGPLKRPPPFYPSHSLEVFHLHHAMHGPETGNPFRRFERKVNPNAIKLKDGFVSSTKMQHLYKIIYMHNVYFPRKRSWLSRKFSKILQDGWRFVFLRKATPNFFSKTVGKLDSDLCVWQISWSYLNCISYMEKTIMFMPTPRISSSRCYRDHPQKLSSYIQNNPTSLEKTYGLMKPKTPPSHLSLNNSLVVHPMNPPSLWRMKNTPRVEHCSHHFDSNLKVHEGIWVTYSIDIASEAPEASMNAWSNPKRLVFFGAYALLEGGNHL